MSKVILITGASSGIGKAIGDLLCNKNFKVYGTSRDPSKYIDSNFQLLSLNVNNSVSIDKCIDEIIKIEGSIDVLINNAVVILQFYLHFHHYNQHINYPSQF
jgi:NADP-dependent 3-hydroxy acid dehydrogenase YdfG